jgi:hypothetical protein
LTLLTRAFRVKLTRGAKGWQLVDVHGRDSPALETTAILNDLDFEERKRLVKRLAGIKD